MGTATRADRASTIDLLLEDEECCELLRSLRTEAAAIAYDREHNMGECFVEAWRIVHAEKSGVAASTTEQVPELGPDKVPVENGRQEPAGAAVSVPLRREVIEGRDSALPSNPPAAETGVYEAELSVLGGMLIDSDAADQALARLGPDSFAHPEHAEIFSAVRTLRGKGLTWGERDEFVLTVKGELRRSGRLAEAGGEEYLAQIVDTVPTAANVGHHIEAVEEDSDAREVGDRSRTRLLTVRAADVEPEAVEWLWWQRIPLGKLTLLTGHPEAGKSTMTCEIAAAVTCGRPLPGDTASVEPADVLVVSAEDGAADTIRPRFDAAGADLSRVHIMQAVQTPTGQEPLCLQNAEHRRAIETKIRRVRPALVIFDPLTAYLYGSDAHKDAEIRAILTPLGKELAERHGSAVVALMHLRKSSADHALQRVSGSIAFGAAARSVLLAGKDPNHPEDSALVQIKSNLARKAPALGYRIAQRPVVGADGKVLVDRHGRDATVSAIEWTGDSDLTADRILASPDAEGATEREAAKEFLRGMLGAGRVLAVEVFKTAKAEGHSESTLRRAAGDLEMRYPRDGFGPGSKVYWELPA